MREIEALQQRLSDCGYIAETELATAIHLAERLQRPLLLEGDAGVGKTAVAEALAAMKRCEFVRLQCYEGLDANAALYEWNYQRQLMAIKLREGSTTEASRLEEEIFSETYLLPRPLLTAITTDQPSVLLIDEIDRADDEFEAFLLEILAEFQITIPEIGTITARHKPTVILTSNATRDLSDALRRRCLYHFVNFPDHEKELQILNSRLPELELHLAGSIVDFVQRLRREHLKKIPGVAETLDWAAALTHIGTTELTDALPQIEATLGCLLKTRADRELATREWLAEMVSGTKAG
jgi:MoxR-like ATPase